MLKQLLTLIILCTPLNVMADVHQCVIDGEITYSDKTCPGHAASPPLPKRVVTPYDNPQWYQDTHGYQQALKISHAKQTPIFIFGYTDWCGYCKKLNRTLLSDPDVKAVLNKFVKVKINPEHSAQDKSLFKSWGGRGYPALFAQSSNASQPKKTPRPFRKIKGQWQMMRKVDFIAMLQAKLDSDN